MILNRYRLFGNHRRSLYAAPRMLLQWHITERCNLRCMHCYQEDRPAAELPFPDLVKVLDQFKDLLNSLGSQSDQQPVRGHITVTGGEPFIRKDFLKLLQILSDERDRCSFAILTNGSFIDSAMARCLRRLNPAFVQVSIEGTQTTHDSIRGPGDHERTVSAIKNLVQEHVRTLISFTAHGDNYREFAEVARLGRQLKVSRVWADRFIPLGNGSALRDLALSPEETREFFQIIYEARCEVARRWFNRTEISMHRALQFLEGGHPYHCTAGETLISVQPNGDIYPCRRMPIPVGNTMDKPLVDLYRNSDLFRSLRDRTRVSNGCQNCHSFSWCRGGLKCLSHAVTGNPFTVDPGCWIAKANDKHHRELVEELKEETN